MPILFRSDGNNDAGIEPWVTDGTVIGTALLRDTSFGGTLDAGGFDIAYTVDSGVIFRVSNDDYDGLWWTNGVAAQTSLLIDDFGTRLYRQGALEFDGDFIVQGFEIASGRGGVDEFLIRLGRDGSQTVLTELEANANSLVDLGSYLLFEDDGRVYGSDGTAAGTAALPLFLSEANAGFGRILQVLPDTSNGESVLIQARSDEDIVTLNGIARVEGNSLWLSDGTEAGTVRLDEIGSISGIQGDIVSENGISFVQVEATRLSVDPDFPNVIVTDREDQLWQVELSSGTTSLIASLDTLYTGDPALPNPQTFGTGLSEPIIDGNQVGFVAFATNRFTDGFISRAEPFAEFYQVPIGTQATPADAVRLEHVPENAEFFIFNDQLVYTVVEGANRQYYAADVETGSSTLILETPSVRRMYTVTEPFLVGANVIFATVQYVGGIGLVQLHSWDGTSNSAVLIGELRGPSFTSSLADTVIDTVIRQDGDLLYFADSSTGLFVTDGTVAGTVQLNSDVDARILGVVPFASPVSSGSEGTFGDDFISGDASANEILGLSGNDSISGAGGNDTLVGDEGEDSLTGDSGFDELRGGFGNDTLEGGANADALLGDGGDDLLIGGDGFDFIEGGAGNDSIFSGAAPDRVFGGDGDDLIDAGSNFGNSVDGVEGGAGNDTIFGGIGFDLLQGGDDDDEIDGGDQADNLYGEDGNDTLNGGNGFDRLFGGEGDDLLEDFEGFGGQFGGGGNDTMRGGDDNTNFFGQLGNDLIEAGGGDDRIGGNAGFDIIDGGAGNDLMFGDFNADTFVFQNGHGVDTIGDFDALNTFERIDLSAVTSITSLADLNLGSASTGAATQMGANVEIDTGGGNLIILNNVTIGDLDATDFLF